MNETLTKLQTVTAVGGETSVTFNNIPQNYTDLKIFASVRGARTGAPVDNLLIGFNGAYTNVTSISVYGAGSGAAASGTAANWVGIVPSSDGSSSTAYTYSNTEIYIPNYTSSNYKNFYSDSVSEYNGTTSYTLFEAGLWSSNAAVTSISLKLDVTLGFIQYSEFALYGIKNTSTILSNSIKATGGFITTDSSYVYHTFLSAGSFQPTTKLLADVLVVAGGGGGSMGGGGAGGLVGLFNQSLTAGTSYPIQIGAGGSAGGSASTSGGNGVNSYFGTTLAIGGGGAGHGDTSGNSGGSGGAAGGSGSTSYVGGAGTSGQGNNGGNNGNFTSANFPGGGGGGAGGAGGSATGNNSAGNGGIGSGAYSAWGLATQTGQLVNGVRYYAGGGGGGFGNADQGFENAGYGGYGGGGNGSEDSSVNFPGTANTGGGGGGTSSNGPGSAGGSGIVIVRYKA